VLVEFACSFGECYDNNPTNIASGCDYTIQEQTSVHIQDIALRNCLKRFGLWFEGPKSKLLQIRSQDSNGYIFGPGNVPFYNPDLIDYGPPDLTPQWANKGSVESFWQNTKYLQVKKDK
jgi:hypothetical protein